MLLLASLGQSVLNASSYSVFLIKILKPTIVTICHTIDNILLQNHSRHLLFQTLDIKETIVISVAWVVQEKMAFNKPTQTDKNLINLLHRKIKMVNFMILTEATTIKSMQLCHLRSPRKLEALKNSLMKTSKKKCKWNKLSKRFIKNNNIYNNIRNKEMTQIKMKSNQSLKINFIRSSIRRRNAAVSEKMSPHFWAE